MTDADLLTQYRDQRSAEAFSELVGRHSGWVYAVARRRVGDEHLANDVAQAVFILLAERAGKIRDPGRLAAWLQRTTLYASNHAIRDRQRGRARERAAAAQRHETDPTADPAKIVMKSSEIQAVEETVACLNSADRSLIIHRFYQGQSLVEVGTELGISEDAVRKRVDRALNRIKLRLIARGVSANTSAGIFAGLLSLNKLGPSDVGRVFVPIRPDATARAVSIAKGVTHMQIMKRIKVASAGVVIVLTVGIGVLLACDTGQSSGGRPAQPASVESSATNRVIQSSGLIVVVSADRSKITGFSNLTGTSQQLSAQNIATDHVIVSDGVAVYWDSGHVYGYSATTGKWSTIDLPKLSDPSSFSGPAVATHTAAVSIPGFVYGFSAETGTWATLTVPSGKKVTPAVANLVITVEADDKFYIFGKSGKWSDGL